ncbi:MAG: TIM barrel protein [Chitinivibrionales bacterium]|nr:TIM barrel protein [Chitinivibrionales bacterium]MBD3358215.1 TIM barrel protein [Chitinivibrionales bacterium]
MSDWPVGLSTGCFYTRSIFDTLEKIVHNGFSMIEVCSSPAHLDYHDDTAVKEAAALIKTLGVEPYSFHAPFAEAIDITSLDPATREYSGNEIRRAVEAAARMGVRHFVLHPGPERPLDPEPGERLTRLRNAASVLDPIADYCRRLGVCLVLENMLPHLLFGNVQDTLWILGALRSIAVGTCLDTGHAYLSREFDRVTYKLSGHLALIHASDNNGERDDHLPPGKGTIEWERFFLAITRTGFRGSIIMELAGKDNRDPDELLAEARQARRYLRDISRKLTVALPPTVEGPDSAEY